MKADQAGSEHNNMRDRIIHAAIRLFANKGYHGTSLADIAKICKIQKPSIFYHFVSKESLALEAIEVSHGYCEQHIFAHARNRKRFFKAITYYYHQQPYAAYLNAMTTTLDGVNPIFTKRIAKYFMSWLKALTLHFAKYHTLSQARLLAENLLMYFQGATVLKRLSLRDFFDFDSECIYKIK